MTVEDLCVFVGVLRVSEAEDVWSVFVNGFERSEKGKNTESYLWDTRGSSISVHMTYLLGRSSDAREDNIMAILMVCSFVMNIH